MGRDTDAEGQPNKLKGIINSIFKKNGAVDPQEVHSAADVCQQSASARHTAADGRRETAAKQAVGIDDITIICGGAKASSDTGSAGQPAAAGADMPGFDNARENVLSDPGLPLPMPAANGNLSSVVVCATDIAAVTASLPVGQRSSNGSINEPGASVWLHEATISTAQQSPIASPVPTHRTGPRVKGGKAMCQSVDDLYSIIFGDAIHSPASSGDALGSCPNTGRLSLSGASHQCGTYQQVSHGLVDINPTVPSMGRYSSNGSIGQSSAARSSSSVIGPLDDLMVPAGLARIRTGRPSGSDGSGSGFCAESPAYSSSERQAEGGSSWHMPAVAAMAATLGPGPGLKCSSRYGNNSYNYSATGAPSLQQQSATGGAQQAKKRLWDRRHQATVVSEASSGYSSTGPSTPCPGVVTTAGSSSAPGGQYRSRGPASLAEIAARLGGGCSPSANCGTPYPPSSCSVTPVSHSYSNPDLAGVGPGNLPPTCARALFGGVSQTDRSLMSTGSSSWLTRADSCLGDHLSVASDDDYIREVNADNVLSSVWGPANGASKLLSFKYSAATSPLNHHGRASPFRASPFGSPRRENSMADLLPLRSAASATAAHSCPGSPLTRQLSNNSLMEEAAAAQQRHRHPFGRCTTDAVTTYRPSPLQQQQQHQRGYSDPCDQQQHQLQDHGGVETYGADLASAAEQQQRSNLQSGLNQVHHSVMGQASQALLTQGSLGSTEASALHVQQSASQKMITVESQHGSNPYRNSRCTSSSRSARAAGSPAAAVSALMTGWSEAATAVIGSEAAVKQQQLNSPEHLASSSSPLQVHLPMQPVEASNLAMNHSLVPAQQLLDGRLIDVVAVTTDNAVSRTETPFSDNSGGSGLLTIRSKSMPTPGVSYSGSGISGSTRGIASMIAGASSPAMQGLATSYSTPPPHPYLHTAASTDFQVQQPRRLGSSASGSRRTSPMRKSSRLSGSNIPIPSRLSQSSAADEPEQLTCSRSRSSNGSILYATPGTTELDIDQQQDVSDQAGATQAASDMLITQRTVSVQFALSRSSSPDMQQLLQHRGGADSIMEVTGQAAPVAASQLLAAGQLVDGLSSNSLVTAHQQQSPPATDAAAVADSLALLIMPSLPEVDFIERIGRGSFGDVFKGVWCGSTVAIKVIRVKQQTIAAHMRTAVQQNVGSSPDNRCLAATASPLNGTSISIGTNSALAQHLGSEPQLNEQQQREQDHDGLDQQIAMELAQHEYESWLNANLRHPNIVQLFTSFTVVLEDLRPSGLLPGALGGVDGFMWSAGVSWKTHLVMEYCELGNMQGALQRGLFVDPQCPLRCNLLWVLITAKEFCVAVAYLHAMDVVHGDLKSSNVLLKAAATTPLDGRGFQAKVSDFGLSRVMDAISAANGTAAATAESFWGGDTSASTSGSGAPLGHNPAQHFGALSHAAPELIRGEALGKASDVYSVGVLLWELVTGQAPFYGTHPGQLLNMKLTHSTSNLLQFPDTAPPSLASLALDCWADNPAQRPSMVAVIDRLNSVALDLLGEEQAVMQFPDIARKLSAQRRSLAAAAGTGSA